MQASERVRLTVLPRPDRLEQGVNGFFLDCEARNLSPRTLQYYHFDLGRFREYLDSAGVRAVEDVQAAHLRAYLVRVAESRSPGGVHGVYRVLKAFLRWYWLEHDLTTPCPIRKVRAPKYPRKLLDPVPKDSVRAMVATCDHTAAGDRDRAALLTLLDSGCRAAEFLALNVGDVNMRTGMVIIRHGKGDKPRVTFLSARTREELARYLQQRRDALQDAPLWCGGLGEHKRLTYGGLRQLVRRRAEAAGVPVPPLHSFRRAFAVMCLRAGMDVFTLQGLMGHADLSVLRRYLAQTPEDLQAAHLQASPVDHL